MYPACWGRRRRERHQVPRWGRGRRRPAAECHRGLGAAAPQYGGAVRATCKLPGWGLGVGHRQLSRSARPSGHLDGCLGACRCYARCSGSLRSGRRPPPRAGAPLLRRDAVRGGLQPTRYDGAHVGGDAVHESADRRCRGVGICTAPRWRIAAAASVHCPRRGAQRSLLPAHVRPRIGGCTSAHEARLRRLRRVPRARRPRRPRGGG